MMSKYGEYIMGPLRRVTGGQGHTDSGSTEPVGSYVLKIAMIGDKDGLEYIVGELHGGGKKTVVLSGTALEGWVIDALYAHGATVFLGSWVELGMRDDEMYIELLMTSDDFDLVHAEKLLGGSQNEYNLWKTMHLLPRSVEHSGELYYGRVEGFI